LLEESWPEIGWNLKCLRDRRNSTIEDVGKTFEPVKQKPHNSGLAAALYRESCEFANGVEIRKNRERAFKLDSEFHQTQFKREEQQRLCLEVQTALAMASPGDKGAILDEGKRRQERLVQIEHDLMTLESECRDLRKRLLDQEAYRYRSELLDFLHARRYAIDPRNLANALAGLPLMRWRQSFIRCCNMTFDPQKRHEYCVFEVISRIWRRVPKDSEEPPVGFFRDELLKLPKKFGYTRQFLWENWSDLKLAIQECWTLNEPRASFPFVISSILFRNTLRQKNAAERILAQREKLEA
jgi:hypothetical protein